MILGSGRKSSYPSPGTALPKPHSGWAGQGFRVSQSQTPGAPESSRGGARLSGAESAPPVSGEEAP